MKNFILCLLPLFSLNIMTSQVFVKDNSYVFVNNTVLFAKGNLELNGTNSNLYLRNNAQFLQGTTSTSTNVGTGKLSVFQEGTSDNYEYNYWCSPVGNASTSTGNEKFDIGMLYSPITNVSSTQAATTGSYNGIASPLTIAKYWIWTFRAGSAYSNWFHISDISNSNSNALKAGEGFTMKGTAGSDSTNPGEATVNNSTPAGAPPPGFVHNQRYDFRGKPNDGNIDIAVLAPVAGVVNSTLTGNPYPSAINLNYFLLENSGRAMINYTTGTYGTEVTANKVIDGAAYFWEQNKTIDSHNIASYQGGYGTYVPNGVNANTLGTYTAATFSTYNLDGSVATVGASSGGTYKRMFCPVGQGFMVNGDVSASVIKPAVMKNAYRIFKQEDSSFDSQFERNSNNEINNNLTNWDAIPNVAGVDYTQFSKLPVPQIKIRTVLNDLYTKEVAIAFNPNTTDGYDTAMEALSLDEFGNDMYLGIPNNSNPFVITTLPFAMEKRIPVTLKSAGVGTFKIKVENFINFDETDTVYFYDNVTGMYHNIVANAYEFSLPDGIYSNRFEITFQNTALSTPTITKNNFVAVQNNNSQLLSISNPNSLDVQSVILYDISGKQIFNKAALGAKTTYEFPTATLSDGVYIVSLKTTNNQFFTQKIIVKSTN